MSEKTIKLDAKYLYRVIFTRNIFSVKNNSLISVFPSRKSSVIVFLDSGLVKCWPFLEKSVISWSKRNKRNIDLACEPQIVQGGEQVKNRKDIADKISRIISRSGLCRHSFVIMIGGGAVLDAVGFASSICHRGIYQIRIPTTVLSQADSGVGVKNSINRFGIKNYYGTFVPPFAVINDYDFIKTLSKRDWLSGIAEAFKVAVIKDKWFLEFLFKNSDKLFNRDQKTMEKMIERCASLHLDHIEKSGDPFESGSARPLDFGHWSSHKLESLTNYRLKHGEAVAIGIALDLCSAMQLGLINSSERDNVLNAMERSGLVLWHPALKQKSENNKLKIIEGLEEFREHLGGELTLAMPDKLGRKTDIYDLPEKIIKASILALEKRFGK